MIAALLGGDSRQQLYAADPEFNPDNGPVKIVVGFQPGGIGGHGVRLVLQRPSRSLSQPARGSREPQRRQRHDRLRSGREARVADGLALVQCFDWRNGVSVRKLPGVVLLRSI